MSDEIQYLAGLIEQQQGEISALGDNLAKVAGSLSKVSQNKVPKYMATDDDDLQKLANRLRGQKEEDKNTIRETIDNDAAVETKYDGHGQPYSVTDWKDIFTEGSVLGAWGSYLRPIIDFTSATFFYKGDGKIKTSEDGNYDEFGVTINGIEANYKAQGNQYVLKLAAGKDELQMKKDLAEFANELNDNSSVTLSYDDILNQMFQEQGWYLPA